MPTEYENYLQQENNRHTQPTSAEWIGDETDSEASYMTDSEDLPLQRNPHQNRERLSSNISDISDFSISDIDSEDEDDEIDHICTACGGPEGQVWVSWQNPDIFICRDCMETDINNINCSICRDFLSELGESGVRVAIENTNMEHLRDSAVLNPDAYSNLETNHQGVEYLAVESVFELVTHGGFLPRDEFNKFLNIVAYTCHRAQPDTGCNEPLTDIEKTLYRPARQSHRIRFAAGEAPLIELQIPRGDEAWNYPSDNTEAPPVEEVHNLYGMDEYATIVIACATFMAHNFDKIRYS